MFVCWFHAYSLGHIMLHPDFSLWKEHMVAYITHTFNLFYLSNIFQAPARNSRKLSRLP